jgi:large subunit ribosomal protein L10
MARADKAAAVAELTTALRDASAAVLTEYRGLTVAELKELRRSLAGNATYSVVKNTLTKIAAREAGLAELEPLLEGPSAIAFISGDPVEVAKGLRNFTKDHPLLVIKGGVLDGATISADDIKKLASLESREVLLAKLAGGFAAPATQLVNVLAAPMRQLAQVLGAIQEKAAADPTWAGAGNGQGGSDGASATDPTPNVAAEAPATDEAPASEEAPAADEAPAFEEARAAATATEEAPTAEAAATAIADTPADTEPATDAQAATATEAPAVEDTPADTAPAADATADEAPAPESTTDETDGVADAPLEN